MTAESKTHMTAFFTFLQIWKRTWQLFYIFTDLKTHMTAFYIFTDLKT